ncbi:helix-turn-helix domain-containing protein [Clostridium sediminicola]|uniref:helix-turn-helix transcriptional regulator n=1 Tax=Clostridium sediminicola TaxID=3114879 RepID=UPI0031F1D25B
MNREEFIDKIDSKVKLIRNEKDFTQDKMARIIGISKKTLVQVEKGRSSIGWMGAISVCSIFKDSEILQMTFGGDTQDIIRCLAFDNYEENYNNLLSATMGGKIWWKEVEGNENFKIQVNIVSNHYRILDNKNRRISFSFDIDYIKKRYSELSMGGGEI